MRQKTPIEVINKKQREKKVVNMDGVEHVSPLDNMKDALLNMLELAPLLREQQAITAPLVFNYYQELINAGFTKEQAFEYVKHNGYIESSH